MIKKQYFIIGIVILASLIMSFVDGVIMPPYMVKSLIKMGLFIGLPFAYFYRNKEDINIIKTLFIIQKKQLIHVLLLGIGVYSIVLVGYFIFKNFIDFTTIQNNLVSGIGVNKDNFIYVAIYISFVNSLLEEFFFRGFSFFLLKEKTSRIFAYGFSSFLFAMYHVGMTTGWFHPIVYVLALAGLFIGGCIFAYLNEKSDSIYPSWIVHMFANFAINTVGCILFGIL